MVSSTQGDSSMASNIDYELFLACVHCGLCTSSCPTYVELGDENDSPRGRIYLMRALEDRRIDMNPSVRRHLDLCLDCRACESACPSGVQYGKLIEPFRSRLAAEPHQAPTWRGLQSLLLFHLTPHARRMRWALAPVRLLQRFGLDRWLEHAGLLRLLPPAIRRLYDMTPRLGPYQARLPEFLPAMGKRRARVALFTGCAADAFIPETNWHTARVLQYNGCDVWVPRRQVCCGALHYHAGLEQPARDFAARNVAAFCEPVDAIITNAAGCGAMLKDYGHPPFTPPYQGGAQGGRQFATRVRDISEFLIDLGPLQPRHPVPLKAVYHDACHLCHAQQIRRQPRQLLEMIPKLQLLPLHETELCCGAAGSYNVTQPEMAERLGLRKVRNILDSGADAVLAANVGCLIQIGTYLRHEHPDVLVAHPIDFLWASYYGHDRLAASLRRARTPSLPPLARGGKGGSPEARG
jgi:glycolate oxidase iron-sulfur subunit